MLRDGGVDEIVVVTGHREQDVQRALNTEKVNFAHNPDPDSQMGASVASGIENVSDESTAILIALVDQPAVPPAVVHTLLESHARGGFRILVPEFRGRGGHPILVDFSLRSDLLNLDQDRGLRGLMDRFAIETRRVPVSSPFIARDMDTWQDYLSLHRDALGFPSPLENISGDRCN